MSQPSLKPTTQQLAQLFIAGWNYIRSNNTNISSADNARIDLLINLAQNPDIALFQLEALVSLSSLMPISNYGYKEVEPVTHGPETLTCFQFGQGRVGWYFAKGSNQEHGFTYILFRLEIAPPEVVAAFGIAPRHAVLYTITAGCGNKQKWYNLPRTVVVGDYKCNPTSQLLVSFTGQTDLIGAPFQSTTFSISRNYEINISASWIDGVLPTGTPIILQATMRPKVGTSAAYNGPGGCLPCVQGAGSLYWSFTNMDISNMQIGDKNAVKLINKNALYGTNGWFDHQWINSSTSGTYAEPDRWLWLPVQINETNTQYMIVVLFPPNQILPLSVGQRFTATFVNKYSHDCKCKKTLAEYNTVRAEVTILQVTIGPQGQVFPTKYGISISDPDHNQPLRFVLSNTFSKPTIVTLPNGIENWEAPGTLTDSTENKILGAGFLEANQLSSADEIIVLTASPLRLDPAQLRLFLTRPNSGTGTIVTSTGTRTRPTSGCGCSSKKTIKDQTSKAPLEPKNNSTAWVSILMFVIALALIILAVWLFTRNENRNKRMICDESNSILYEEILTPEYGELFGSQ